MVVCIDIIKSRRRIGCWTQEMRPPSWTGHTQSCVAAEDTRCQTTVQHIPAQIGGPSQTAPGGLLFRRRHSLASTTIILICCHRLWLCVSQDNHICQTRLSCAAEREHEKEALQNSPLSGVLAHRPTKTIVCLYISNVFIHCLCRLCIYL